MNSQNMAPDTIGLTVSLDDEGLPVVDTFSNITDDMSEEARIFLELMLSGLEFTAHSGSSFLASVGNVVTLLDSHESELEFEPDEELLDAISNNKVVPINRNKKPH